MFQVPSSCHPSGRITCEAAPKDSCLAAPPVAASPPGPGLAEQSEGTCCPPHGQARRLHRHGLPQSPATPGWHTAGLHPGQHKPTTDISTQSWGQTCHSFPRRSPLGHLLSFHCRGPPTLPAYCPQSPRPAFPSPAVNFSCDPGALLLTRGQPHGRCSEEAAADTGQRFRVCVCRHGRSRRETSN